MKSFCVLVALTLVLPHFAFGQKDVEDDGPVGIFDSRTEYYEFMGGAKSAAYGENGSAEMQAMIPMLNDMALGQPFGTTAGKYNSEISQLGLMSDPKVREEIGMVDEQYDELQKMNEEIQKRMAERIRAIDFTNNTGMVDELKSIRRDSEEELESLFLPEQLERLRQLANQSKLRNGRRSLVDLLTSQPLKDELDISNRQVDELRETEEAIEREIQEELARLREKAKERILSKLDSDQREEVELLFGDVFQFAPIENSKSGQRNRKQSWGKGK